MRVVITGMGTINPIGHNVKESWDNLINLKCGIDNISFFDTSNYRVKLAAEIKNLNLDDYFDKKEIRSNDRFTLLAKIAAKEAILDSGIDFDKVDLTKFGAIISSGIGGLETFEENIDALINKGPNRVSPFFIPKTLSNIASGVIAIDYGLKGHTSCIVTACAASTNAIGEAYRKIKDGYEDLMLAGGCEAGITKAGIAGFMSMRALHEGSDKNRASIPFDKDRSGFVMGEGGSILVLESLDSALKRNSKIYAEIVGYGDSCDAYHITAPDPNSKGAALALDKAIKEANIDYTDIGYINAHGTSTTLNDSSETNLIKMVFKENYKDILVSSTKSSTGHLLGGAGAVEAVFTALALKDGIIPPTINYLNKDEECDLNLVVNKPIKKDIKYAMSNSLGFGGHNAVIILKKWEM